MNHLIIFAHPNAKGSFGRAIADRVAKTGQALGVLTQFRDLYTMNFNPIISFEELQAANKGIIPEEVKHEHNLILQADLISLVYPLWWMGFPAMLKGYLDGLLKGKQMQQFITIGSNVDKYKECGMDKSLDHCLVNGLFNYCGIDNVSYELFGDIHLIDDAARRAMLDLAEQKTREKLTILLQQNAQENA